MIELTKRIILILLVTLCISFLCLNLSPVDAIEAPFNSALREKVKEDYTRIELKGGVKVDRERQVVTLNLRESDLRQVLRMLANKAGKNIIIHDSVEGLITLDLMEVELNKAIEYIMTIKELSYWEDGNTLIIANNEIAKDLGLNAEEIRGIKIKHVDASRIAEFLNANIFSINRPNTSYNSIVTTNPSSNEILIFGSKEDIKLAQEVVEYLDVKPNVTNFTVNYGDPESLASKICWTVFKSPDGSTSIQRPSDLSEGSNINLICGSTADPAEANSNATFTEFRAPSYWVLADTGLNQITIYGGTQEQLNLAQEIITSFDKREPQVYMEISIIELSEIGSKTLSNAFSLASETDTITFDSGTTIFPAIELFGRNQHHTVDKPSLVTTIETVIEENKGRVLANPRIIAANNTQSTVNITSEIIDTTTQTQNDVGGTISTTTNYNKGSEGIEFTILPKITPSGYVHLTVEPKYDNVKNQITEDNQIKATLLNTRSLSVKNVRVKDGETLILGGLIQETETISHKKFPVLGDLPILGVLFQDQGTSKTRSELIIMITPRILYDPDQTVEAI